MAATHVDLGQEREEAGTDSGEDGHRFVTLGPVRAVVHGAGEIELRGVAGPLEEGRQRSAAGEKVALMASHEDPREATRAYAPAPDPQSADALPGECAGAQIGLYKLLESWARAAWAPSG